MYTEFDREDFQEVYEKVLKGDAVSVDHVNPEHEFHRPWKQAMDERFRRLTEFAAWSDMHHHCVSVVRGCRGSGVCVCSCGQCRAKRVGWNAVVDGDFSASSPITVTEAESVRAEQARMEVAMTAIRDENAELLVENAELKRDARARKAGRR